MKKILFVTLGIFITTVIYAQNEVIYHVFQRSFYDSNGDRHGDLKGLKQKLGYLQDLGVTSILITPLYQSAFYHNYFATDFEKIDPEYGSMEDYLDLVKEVHRRGMKIYQDVEMQYVTHEHPWFVQSYNNPDSRFGKYIFYLDSLNQKPFWFYNIPEFTTYNNLKQKIAVVNMNNPEVRQYTSDVLNFWIDPNKDGVFDDGVDGFRLDHMMDDLDNFKKLPNLFKNFWIPVLTRLKETNPSIVVIAEQANWFSFGREYFSNAKVDRVFAFHLSWAIESFDKKKLMEAADSTLTKNPENKQQIVFIENHDTRRVASVKDMNPEKLKTAATLNLLLGGVPLLYYGQELGMKGTQIKGPTDGNDIPIREAFEWYQAGDGKGTALWYKNGGPWWDRTNIKPNDGISLEEQQHDPGSLWNHYKKIIQLRKSNPVLADGKYQPVINDNDHVFTFLRFTGEEGFLIAVNLSSQMQRANATLPSERRFKSAKSLLNKEVKKIGSNDFVIELLPSGLQIFKLN
jgi:alpha-amylase